MDEGRLDGCGRARGQAMRTASAGARRRCRPLVAVVRSLVLAAVAPAFALAAPGGTCTIVLGASGTLKPDALLSSLGTKNAGGVSARATVTASNSSCVVTIPSTCFQLTVVPPSSFMSAPANGNVNVSFQASMTVAGSSSLLNILSLLIVNGSTLFDLDLKATKSSGMFSAGAYQAEEVLRCE